MLYLKKSTDTFKRSIISKMVFEHTRSLVELHCIVHVLYSLLTSSDRRRKLQIQHKISKTKG